MIDLHVHTIYSDGEYTPTQILDMCNDKGVTIVGITDHNTMEGCKRAVQENPYKNLKVISGLELGAKYNIKGANLHILGYNVDIQNRELNDVCTAVMKDNVMRLESLVSLLKTHYNFSFKEEDLDRIYNSIGNIGRPDIAKLCVQYGYTQDIEETFSKYFNPIDDKIAKRKAELTDKECIEYILNAGGTPCLAHPIELKKEMDDLKQYVQKLVSYGLQAIEVYQSKHSQEYTKQLLEITKQNGLLYSVGSDYHGPIMTPDIELGYGKKQNLCLDEASILSKILR